jgi:hypothetical protein
MPERCPSSGLREPLLAWLGRSDVNQNASNRERMEAAAWLADRGFGKPTVNAGSQAPGFGDFTIKISDHDIMGNPINALPRD